MKKAGKDSKPAAFSVTPEQRGILRAEARNPGSGNLFPCFRA